MYYFDYFWLNSNTFQTHCIGYLMSLFSSEKYIKLKLTNLTCKSALGKKVKKNFSDKFSSSSKFLVFDCDHYFWTRCMCNCCQELEEPRNFQSSCFQWNVLPSQAFCSLFTTLWEIMRFSNYKVILMKTEKSRTSFKNVIMNIVLIQGKDSFQCIWGSSIRLVQFRWIPPEDRKIL